MEPKLIEPRFPLSGVVRRLGHWGDAALSEQPYTPWAVNCRPEDPFEHRLRGGSRPGLMPYAYGEEPEWPTGELYTEGGDILIDEDGRPVLDEDGNPTLSEEVSVPITDENGETITVPIWGSSAVHPEIAEAMKAYGYGAIPDSLDQHTGAAPTGGTVGCVYRGRLVVASGGIVYMSRQGDYGDWEYGADVEDAGRAVVLQLSEADEVGESVVALVPHKDVALIMATEHELWVLDGDAADGGVLRNVSRDVGIISSTAWTKAGDTVFFLSADGLYSLQANGAGLKDMSGDRLPTELSDVDVNNYTVMLGYSHADGGVYVFIDGSEYHWFFDLGLGGFWPFTLPIAVSAAFIASGSLVVLDSDNSLWTFDGEDDDGEDIASHVLFGPFRISGAGHLSAILTGLQGAVEVEPGGTVTWRIVTGDYAESACRRAQDAVDNYVDGNTETADEVVAASGTWGDGRTGVSHPRVSGGWVVVWLSSNDVWAFDNMLLEVQPLGHWR